MLSRFIAWLAAATLLVVLAVGHFVFWYLPRARAMDTGKAQLLTTASADGQVAWRLWMPYPHQNLPALAGGRDELDRWIAAAAKAAGEDVPIRFGPLALPPCRELAVTGFEDGSVAVAADVYPALAAFARMAGAVAGNPWLSGGEVGEGEDRQRILWEDGVWTVTPLGKQSPVSEGADETSALSDPEIGLVTLTQRSGPLPAGLYRIESAESELRLESVATPASPDGERRDSASAVSALGSLPTERSPAVLLFTGAASPMGRAGSGLALFSDESASSDDEGGFSIEVPDLGVFYRDEEDRWELPAEGIARLFGSSEADWNGWGIRGWNRAATEKVRTLIAAEGVESLLGTHDLAYLATVDVKRAHALVETVADALEATPFVRRSEAEKWRNWEGLLAACSDCRRLELIAQRDQAVVRLEQ